MDITRIELSEIQADIGDHRYRVARLLEDVDALRRSVVELGVATLTGRTGTMLDLCTSRIRAGDVAMGQVAAHFERGPSSRNNCSRVGDLSAKLRRFGCGRLADRSPVPTLCP